MKITGVSQFNFNKKNLNFGKFRDKNAYNVVKKTLLGKDADNENIFPPKRMEFDRLADCKYVDIYTTEDGSVDAEFDMEYLKQFPMSDDYTLDRYEGLEKYKNLSRKNYAAALSLTISTMDRIIDGETIMQLLEETRGDFPYTVGIDCAKRNAEEMPYW